jgi:hypothetical protein
LKERERERERRKEKVKAEGNMRNFILLRLLLLVRTMLIRE